MGKFDGVLLAVDYDDTLYSSKKQGISQENRDAIAYFMSEGGYFTVATGRSYTNFTIQMSREKPPLNCPAILSNGASIYDYHLGYMLYECLMPAAIVKDMDLLCRRYATLGFEAYCGDEVYLHNPNSITDHHMTRAGLIGHEMPVLEMPKPWIKAIIQQEDREILRKAQGYMRSRWGEKYEVIFSNPFLLEVTDKGIQKGSSVLWLAHHLGVKHEDIYCMGNGENDVPMVEVSALKCVPANGVKVLQEECPVKLPSCEDHCVAALVALLDERYA